MNLILNKSYHWEVLGGAELHIGDIVELNQNGEWVKGRVAYRPNKEYVIRLESGHEIVMNDLMDLRVQHYYEQV